MSSPAHEASSYVEEDDSVLRDVLDELDRERSQRAELEAKVRALLEKESTTKPTSNGNTAAVSIREWTKLKTENEGLRELLDALSTDNPAFHAATQSTSLPLHVVRLLEIMPWDSRARQHALCTEELFEWQYYVRNQWVQQIRHFPPQLKNLPVVRPKPGEEPNTRRKGFFGELTSPPKHVVLTDAKMTSIVNIDGGYPLPDDDATWEWVAGWRVDKHVAVPGKEQTMDCDEEGWSYAKSPHDFSTRELCWDRAEDENGKVIRRYRRRRWSRRRVLVSYPNVSQRTREYLRLLGENARLGVSVDKLSDQLVETKTALTETEDALMQTKEDNRLELERMRAKVQATEELFNELELGLKLKDDEDDSSIKAKFIHVDNLRKEQTEKIQKLMRASSWNGSKAEGGGASPDGDANDDQRFDWKRLGRGGLIDQIKRSPGLLPGRKSSRDDTSLLNERSGSPRDQEKSLLILPDDDHQSS